MNRCLVRLAAPLLALATPASLCLAATAPAAQSKAEHMLQRFSFGPTPGEVQQVAAQGVYRWFAEQLHPEAIDDSALDARLASYPAVALPPATLAADYPPPSQAKQALAGLIATPTDPAQNAVWQNQMKRAEQKRDTAQPMQGTGTPAAPLPDIQSLLAQPPAERYQSLIHLPPGSMQPLMHAMPAPQRPQLVAGFAPTQRDTILALISPRLVVVNQQESARLLRDIYSQRQLQQVMTEFWLNHFNIATGKDQREPYYVAQFANEAVARHALGHFEDLLDAVAESPAMLLYLDNVQSTGPNSPAALRHHGAKNINENYGRELMELHTVGVNSDYTQADVIAAATVLTGWTVAPLQQGGGFRFNPALHEPGPKTVLGHTIPAGGQEEGLALLHLLATSPATARMLCTQLAVRFVGDDPPPALVHRMVATYSGTDGNIGAVLTTLVHSPEFWSATGNKVKTPLDFVVSAARATGADVTEPYRLVSELRVMGMPLSGTQEPNGYPMTSTAWSSTSELVDRLNFALALASNRIPGVSVSLPRLIGPFDPYRSPAQQEAALEKVIFSQAASPQVHSAVMQSLATQRGSEALSHLVLTGYQSGSPFAAAQSAPTTDPTTTLVLGLLLGSPEFQSR